MFIPRTEWFGCQFRLANRPGRQKSVFHLCPSVALTESFQLRRVTTLKSNAQYYEPALVGRDELLYVEVDIIFFQGAAFLLGKVGKGLVVSGERPDFL